MSNIGCEKKSERRWKSIFILLLFCLDCSLILETDLRKPKQKKKPESKEHIAFVEPVPTIRRLARKKKRGGG